MAVKKKPTKITEPKVKESKPKKTPATKTSVAKVSTKKELPTVKGTKVNVFDMQGKQTGQESLPEEIFGQKPNKTLLAQAVRVYSSTMAHTTAHTKTRGEVRGGGAKPWRQKGTGRARAGSSRSPVWVGGGIVFGPRYSDSKMTLPQKMKRKALVYALSAKTESGDIKLITNIEKVQPKTKSITFLLSKLETKGTTLIVVSDKNENLKLATRNIQGVFVDVPQNLNAYEILRVKNLLISKEAIEKFQ